jgi:hypothetical protein
MWAVGITRPYYPSVEFFADEQLALEQYNDLLKEHVDTGNFDAKIFISKVIDIKEINTDY